MAEKRWEVRGKGGDENVLKSIVVVVVPSLLPGRLVPESKTCLKPNDLCTLSGWIVWYRDYISKKAIIKIKERNGKKKKVYEWMRKSGVICSLCSSPEHFLVNEKDSPGCQYVIHTSSTHAFWIKSGLWASAFRRPPSGGNSNNKNVDDKEVIIAMMMNLQQASVWWW